MGECSIHCFAMEIEIKSTLLIADNDDVQRFILSEIFDRSCEIFEAVNGNFALDFILHKGINPDLVILDSEMPDMDGFAVLQTLKSDPDYRRIPVMLTIPEDDTEAERQAYELGAVSVLKKPFNRDIVYNMVKNALLSITENRKHTTSTVRSKDATHFFSDVTGLWGRQKFIDKVSEFLATEPEGSFAIARWDIDQFKLFNDTYGIAAGDNLLAEIGRIYIKTAEAFGDAGSIYFAHWGADHFVALYREDKLSPEVIYRYTLSQVSALAPEAHISIGFGFYKIDDFTTPVSVMCDRADLARRSVKDQYGVHYAWFHDSMRQQLVEEQKITAVMKTALLRGEFVPYFQPQYNYESKTLIGAEALIRWQSPEGIIPPGKFIPLFERNGFITEVDFYMWESTCKYIRQWKDRGYKVPPISVNISRRDLYLPSLCDRIGGLVNKYELVPADLRLEITESAYMDNPDQLLAVVIQLRQMGFHVEMDDFGSGYSSLNTLKDVQVDMLKLDMKFIAESDNSRGGSILSSVVHMAHGIDLPVIAEGVETAQQAEYLKTINCLYMQGFLFSKPMSADEFEKLLSQADIAHKSISFTNAINNSVDFLDGTSQATLLFNSFVGGAVIVEYENNNLSALRMNDRFYEEIRIPRSTFDSLTSCFLDKLESTARVILLDAAKKAIDSNSETACEIHSYPPSHRFSEQWLFIRFRYLASRFNSHILYASVSNISARKMLEKALYKEKLTMEQILRFAPGGIAEFIADSEDSLTRVYMSESAHEILGYTGSRVPPATSLMSQLRRVLPEDRQAVRETIQAAMAEKKEFTVECRVCLNEGGVRWVNLTANPAVIDSTLHYFGVYTDISRHKALENSQALSFMNNTLSSAMKETVLYGSLMKYLQKTDDRVFIKDINSIYLAASDAFVKMSGHESVDELIGKTDFDIFKDQSLAASYSKMDLELFANGEDMTNFIENVHDSVAGETKLMLTSKYLIRNSSNVVIGLLGITKDISAPQVEEEYRVALESPDKHIFRYEVKTRSFFDVENSDDSISPIRIANGPEKTAQSGSIDPASLDEWAHLFEDIQNGTPDGYRDIQFVEKGCTSAWYRVMFKTIFDDDGQPLSAIISYRKIDDILQDDQQEQLKNIYTYSALTRLYPICAAVNLTYDLVRVLKTIGPGYPGSTPVHTHDDALKNLLSYCNPKDQKRLEARINKSALIKAFNSGEDVVEELAELMLPDGRYHNMELMIVKVNDPIGNDNLCSVLIREIP